MSGKNDYVQLSELLHSMSGSDLKCYLALLVFSDTHGSLRITLRDLADTIGSGANRVSESLRRLERDGYVTCSMASNQQTTAITLTHWRSHKAFRSSRSLLLIGLFLWVQRLSDEAGDGDATS